MIGFGLFADSVVTEASDSFGGELSYHRTITAAPLEMSAWDDVLTGAAAALSIAALLRRRHAVNEESRPRADLVRQRDDLPPVRHDILLLVARGEHTHRVPVWAMRQAGRYLPEFLELRRTADFFTMCQTPALAAELTLQPLRRYADLLDAVVIFSDILIVPQAMGMTVVMETGKGPTFPNPLMSPADVALLNLKPDVPATLSYLFTAISLTRKLAAEIKSVPVIGFAGGPWTLMSYMIEGGGSKTFEKSKSWLFLVSRPTIIATRISPSLFDGTHSFSSEDAYC